MLSDDRKRELLALWRLGESEPTPQTAREWQLVEFGIVGGKQRYAHARERALISTVCALRFLWPAACATRACQQVRLRAPCLAA